MASRRSIGPIRTTRVRRRVVDPTYTGPTGHTESPNPGPAIITPAPYSFEGDAIMPRANSYVTTSRYGLPENYGFTNPNPGGTALGDSTPGGGAPAWACALIGRSQCSIGDLIAAGLGHLLGGSEPPSSNGGAPGLDAPANGGGPCPGIASVYDPITGRCVNLGDLAPGGDPAFTAPVGEAVHGRYGVGVRPGAETITRAKCPAGFALGKDGVCYEGLHRNSPRRKWPMGQKPLMTAGDRSAIRRASKVANKLKREKKSLKKASRALDKVC